MTSYQKNGYLLVKKAIKKNLLNEIVNDIHNLFKIDLFEIYQNDFNRFLGAANISQYLISVNKLITLPSIVDIVKYLGLKNPVINTRPLLSYSHKNLAKNDMYWKVPAHQDWPSMQGSIDGVTVWIP